MDASFAQALEIRFDVEKKNIPYQNDNEYIRDLMSLVSLYLVSAAACKSACAENAQVGEASNIPESVMSLEEAVCYVGDYPLSVVKPNEELAELVSEACEHIASRLEATKQAVTVLRLERLRELLTLSDFSFFCLCCALSSALDRGFERLFVALHGDTELPFPTLGAVRACYCLAHPHEPEGWQDLLCPSSTENRLLFTPAPPDKPPLLRPIALHPGVLSYLLHEQYMSRELASCSDIIDSSLSGNASFIDGQIRRVSAELREMRLQGEPRMCILCGAAGTGKKLTLAKAVEKEQAELLLVRLDEATAFTDEMIGELVTACLLWSRIPCFSIESAAGNPLLTRILTALKPYGIGVILLTKQLRSNIATDGYLVTRIDYPELNLEESLHFWKLFSSEYMADSVIDCTQLAAKYRLTPGQIKSALRAAGEMAKAEDTLTDTAKIDAAILLGNTGRLSEIADRIHVFYRWDDLVLGDASKQMLRDVCNRIKYRYLVETQWGFGGKSAYGNGISILLYGPPGTGKTMSAQVIAGELGLPIYRINLAQIISKYIGETAKNLDAVFSEAKSSNVILFFDEADALFSKRTDVKNSNDRHANSESSYLLQKIEEYSGISILATNLANNFDEAFRRRIGYMINIHMPSATQRLELWRNAIPKQAPLSSDLDMQLVADNLEFSGSVIKSAALQAAYFAADENTQIGMSHIARAVRRELQKLGKSEPHFLTLYPDT